MKVSELWLREWVNPSLTGQQLVTQLTMAGLEVDGFHPVAGNFDHVVVAKVLQTTPHPQADKLTLCEVDAGGSLIKVVCGASNVRAGLMVALALPGATLPGGMTIKESMLRGELSQGMLCSGSELGLEDQSEGIIELAEDAPIGLDLRDYLSLNDHVFEIDLTPNRADCFSVLGVAREVAALNRLPLQVLPCVTIEPTIPDSLAVHVHAPEGCPQYYGRVIRSINPHATTPLWMQERLRRGGIRLLHPVVDVTNYVMLELGQPLHAFDLQTITGTINVRYGHRNEELTLLNGQDVTLNEQILVIADSEKALAIAGVMGGEFSAVQPDTIDVFLESAYFNPLTVAGVARRFGLSSDSSQRYERGVDPTLQARALERATDLLLSIVGGHVGPITSVIHSDQLPSKITILFHPGKVKQLTGLELPEDEMALMLQGLCMVVDRESQHWKVQVPSYRFDVALDVDLVEEITRLYGYDNIQAQPTMAVVRAGIINADERLVTKASTYLCAKGYHETISYSFVDPELQAAIYPEAEVLSLLNPISSELSQMRAGMWPGLIASMVYNVHRQQTAIKFFEAGVVFDVEGGVVQERACLAGVLTGETGSLNWSEPSRLFDFYDMKGELQSLFAFLGRHDAVFVPAVHAALHEGQTARIMMGDQAVGWIGVLHPRLTDALDLSSDVMLFELSLSKLLDIDKAPVLYRRISKYPQIRRDLSLLVDQDVMAAQIERVVREIVAIRLLKAFDIFDVYAGESIPAGKKSLAIALTLQDDDRTLTDVEINAIIDAIIDKLDEELGILLRD